MRTKTFILFLLVLCFKQFSAFGQIEKVQTAIIYQLTRLIDWCPSGKQGNFTIGVLSDDPSILNELSALQGRRVGEQTIVVRKLSSAQEATSANIVFVARTRIHELPVVISGIGTNCTLVVADQPGAASQGAAISFIEEGGRVQFEVNKSYVERHSLKVSNDLMRLAKNVF